MEAAEKVSIGTSPTVQFAFGGPLVGWFVTLSFLAIEAGQTFRGIRADSAERTSVLGAAHRSAQGQVAAAGAGDVDVAQEALRHEIHALGVAGVEALHAFTPSFSGSKL